MRELLQRIVAVKREEIERRRRDGDLSRRLDVEPPAARNFEAALRTPGLSAVAEIKRRSPSAGPLRPRLDVGAIARRYETHGAAALSVLTDATFFGGSADDLRVARRAVGLPVLRKDFTLDELQIRESRLMGADAVLLIARLLDGGRLAELVAAAAAAGLAAVIEIHAERELRRALDSGARIIGVNARDLDTFDVDLAAALRLRRLIPPDRLAVAESGIRSRADVVAVERHGFDALLVGETLMRADDPGARLGALLEGRR